MGRRNLQREARHLMPRPVTTGWDEMARQQLRLNEAMAAVATRAAVETTDDAFRFGIRLVFDQLVEKARIHWIGGVPAVRDLAAIERRVGSLLGVSPEEVSEALKGHPRPATAG